MPDPDTIQILADEQLESFDTEYVVGGRWDTVKACIDRDFPSGQFRFIDIGGGNGKFCDRLLQDYPRAEGTVLDNSELLLGKNSSDPRKKLIHASAGEINTVTERYDLVCVHWLLHHLVGDGYRSSRHHQLTALSQLSELLATGGRLSVFENIYTGWILESLPGWLIYELTSTRSIASLTSRLGANTAGVGVCFLSKPQWLDTFAQASLEVDQYVEPDDWTWPLRGYWRALLHLKSVKVGHFWLRSNRSSS